MTQRQRHKARRLETYVDRYAAGNGSRGAQREHRGSIEGVRGSSEGAEGSKTGVSVRAKGLLSVANTLVGKFLSCVEPSYLLEVG